MKRTNELTFQLIETYQHHALQVNHSNPVIAEMAQIAVDIDLDMMWMLTQ